MGNGRNLFIFFVDERILKLIFHFLLAKKFFMEAEMFFNNIKEIHTKLQ